MLDAGETQPHTAIEVARKWINQSHVLPTVHNRDMHRLYTVLQKSRSRTITLFNHYHHGLLSLPHIILFIMWPNNHRNLNIEILVLISCQLGKSASKLSSDLVVTTIACDEVCSQLFFTKQRDAFLLACQACAPFNGTSSFGVLLTLLRLRRDLQFSLIFSVLVLSTLPRISAIL